MNVSAHTHTLTLTTNTRTPLTCLLCGAAVAPMSGVVDANAAIAPFPDPLSATPLPPTAPPGAELSESGSSDGNRCNFPPGGTRPFISGLSGVKMSPFEVPGVTSGASLAGSRLLF